MELKERIINAAIDEFEVKGMKFTMDDIAKRINVSKKTIYAVFQDKEDMLVAITDYCFDDIKRSEKAIVNDMEMDITEKIEKILVVMPDRYQNIGLSNLYQLKDKYPNVYLRVAEKLESDWDNTIMLLEQGIKEGKIRDISLPILKAMIESTYQHFFSSTILKDNNISYEQALKAMIDLIMNGIKS